MRNRFFRVPSWAGRSGLALLSVRLDSSMRFGRTAFSLSVVIITGCGTTLASASDAEETMRVACEAVRGQTECGGIIGMPSLD